MTLEIYIDGASRGNPGPAAAAMTVIDPQTGGEIVNKAVFFEQLTNNQAEYEALFLALDFIHHHARQGHGGHYIIHSDSKNLVGQMTQNWKIVSYNRHYRKKAHEIISQIDGLLNKTTIEFKWIPRDQNSHADMLCNVCLDKNLEGKVLQHNNPENPQSLVTMTREVHQQYHATHQQGIQLGAIEISALRKLVVASENIDNLSLADIRSILLKGGAAASTVLRQVNAG